MKPKISIYLAGTIRKEHETNASWSDLEILFLKNNLSEYEVAFLNPALRTDNLSDQFSVFGRDMAQVFCSDIVFVDARNRRGLGVGAEMMWAKFHQIPIITLAPRDSHDNKSKTILLDVPVENWVHPFVESLSDVIVENLLESTTWTKKYVNGSAPKVKDVAYIQSAMQYYRDSQLSQDEPMKALIQANQKLQNLIWGLNEQKKTPAPCS